jgi:endonuclease/exonuclease/phosphatase family metal-dependent hydrolase
MSRPFRKALWELAESDPVWPDSVRLQELALSLLGQGSRYELAAVATSSVADGGDVGAGDLLVRYTALGARYAAVVLSARPERRADLQSRGVPVECAGEGWYVEVAEASPGGGAPRSIGRCFADASGRAPRGQQVLRADLSRPRAHQGARALVDDKREDKPATKLFVMTYNIRLGIESSLKSVGDAVIAAGVPDVLALQEVGVNWRNGEKVDQPRVLAKQLGFSHHVFVGALSDKSGGRFGIALLSRWPFAAADVTLLPQDDDEQRVLLRARIDAPKPFTVLTTHLARKAGDRSRQAPIIGAAAALAEAPVVLLGDLNDEPTSDTLKLIKGSALVDCFELAGTGDRKSYSVKAPKESIDYILCGGGLEAVAGSVTVVSAARASDHFPVSGILEAASVSKPLPKPSGTLHPWQPAWGPKAPFVSPPPP